MPLLPGNSAKVKSKNIREMIKAGHPRKQAIAASLENARRHPKKNGGGISDPTFRESDLETDPKKLASLIPSKLYTPLAEDKERIDRVNPDFYFPERGRKKQEEDSAPIPKRKPTPPSDDRAPVPQRKPTPPIEDKAPTPKRKPSNDHRSMYAEVKPWGAEGGNFFDYKRGGATHGKSGVSVPEIFHGGGLFASGGAGRTDILNRRVEPGSYVVPADVVSALGDGNTEAGARVLDQMMGTQEEPKEQFMDVPQPNYTMKKGGSVPVKVAGGEYLIKPSSIVRKFGDLKHGHNILDAMVKQVRAQNVKKLRSLPGPRK